MKVIFLFTVLNFKSEKLVNPEEKVYDVLSTILKYERDLKNVYSTDLLANGVRVNPMKSFKDNDIKDGDSIIVNCDVRTEFDKIKEIYDLIDKKFQGLENRLNARIDAIENKISNLAECMENVLMILTERNNNTIPNDRHKNEKGMLDMNMNFFNGEIKKKIIGLRKVRGIEYNLIYKASFDGDSYQNIKKAFCKPNILIIIEIENHYRIGGYKELEIDSNGVYKQNYFQDNQAFIFSIDLNRIYPSRKGESTLYINDYYEGGFVSFNYGIYIYGNCLTKKTSNIEGFYDGKIFMNGDRDNSMTGGKSEFRIEEIEIYQVNFKI